MEKSDSIAALAAALAKAQGDFNPVRRSVKVDFVTQKGGRIKYAYTPLSEILESCLKPLSANGLAVMQPTRIGDMGLVVETWLIHSSGEWVKSEIQITSADHSPQAEGSALTYARRYAISSLLGIASEEDDDGEAAQSGGKPATTERKPTVSSQSTEAPPLCNIHKSAMRLSKTGHWYCAIKDTNGSYCKYQAPKPPASPSPHGDVSPPPSDTQAPTPAARLSSDGGQPGETHSQAQQQPQPVASTAQGIVNSQPTVAASARAPQEKPPTDETPSEPVGFRTWGEVAAACANLGVNANQVFARAGVESSKRFQSWLEMERAGWTFQRAWASAQEIKRGAQ